MACLSPKKSLPNINVDFLCRNVGDKLYQKGIFGFIHLDLISFSDCSGSTLSKKETTNSLFWAIGLDCYLNSFGSACFYFDFLMKGKLDQLTGNYSIAEDQHSLNASLNTDYNRQFLYCPTIINEGLDGLQYKTFFQLCRLESISFNLEKKIGSTFILIDSLQSGVISSMTIGTSHSFHP